MDLDDVTGVPQSHRLFENARVPYDTIVYQNRNSHVRSSILASRGLSPDPSPARTARRRRSRETAYDATLLAFAAVS